jgi:hypothetical protein
VVGLVLLLLGVVAGNVWSRSKRLGDALVDEANARSQDFARPVHRLPAVGTTFQACLGTVIDSVPDGGLFAIERKADADVNDVLDGRAEFTQLSTATLAALHRDAAIEREALACSRAPMLGDAPGMGPLAGWQHPRKRRSPQLQINKLALLEAQELLRDGHADDALELCGDVWAFSRDVVYDEGLIGAMLCAAMVQRSMQTCGLAVDRSSAAAKSRFLAELVELRRGLPSFAEILDTERVQIQLFGWGDFLSERQLRQLPANARELVGESSANRESHPVTSMARWLYWSEAVDTSRRLSSAARLPTRRTAVASIDAEHSILLEALTDPGDGAMSGFMRRYDVVPLEFDLLEAAARVDLGLTPLSTVTVTRVDGGVELHVEWDVDAGESVIVHPDSSDAG